MFNHFTGLENDKRASEVLKDIESMKVFASFKDMFSERSNTELLLLTHHSPSQHHLKVWTSTKDAKVLLSQLYYCMIV